MVTTPEGCHLPDFLQSYENLRQHFEEHFAHLPSQEKGEVFLRLAQQLIPLTDEGQAFPEPQANVRKTHDQGIDLLTAETDEGRVLFAQSKFTLSTKDELDSILSKFQSWEEERRRNATCAPLLPLLFDDSDAGSPVAHFFVVTASKLEGILTRYKTSSLAAVRFYEKLVAERRLVILDGPRIFQLLRQLYSKANLLPEEIVVNAVAPWRQVDNVFLGVVMGQEIVRLYEVHGDALFFENIRDFLGTTSGRVVTTRSTVNEEIIRTISEAPSSMLGRNNGVTFRAGEVTVVEEAKLSLKPAALVNGCQTAMCLVHKAPVSEDCRIVVKVVQTEDAWDIAKAANYQNDIARVDLDLARYLRPQLVRKVGTRLGFAVDVESGRTASDILGAIYRNKVAYQEIRLVFLGLFSRKPRNLFDNNYAEVRNDIIDEIHEQFGEEDLFLVLLLLLKASRRALEECERVFDGPEYSSLFKRFYREEKPRYRSFFAIAALCAAVRVDVSERAQDAHEEVGRMIDLLRNAKRLLEAEVAEYERAYLLTFQTIADSVLDIPEDRSESEIAQNMFQKISTLQFSRLYKRILLRVDAERKRQPSSGQG